MNYEDRTSQVSAGQAPPKLLIERITDGPVTSLRLSGVIDEQFDGQGLAGTVAARWLILDLGGVDRISSFGIRQWVDFVTVTATRVGGLYFVECSPKMVDQFNMVANFGGTGHIVSFYAPYRCDACDHDRRRLFRTDEETPLWRAGQAPAFACPTCGNPEYFDEDPATYFTCVAQQTPDKLPPELVSFLRTHLSYGQGGQRKLKIEKRVDGRTTYVKLSGDMDSDLRAQKLADGLEGEVVFDLAEVLSIDPVGTAQWRKLMQLLEGKSGGGEQVDRVHLIAVPALFLERVGRPEDLGKKGQVLSLLVPYHCPRCQATTQRLVDFAAHGHELRAGRVPRTQCNACGGPAQCVASATWLTRVAALPLPQLSETLQRSIARLSSAPIHPGWAGLPGVTALPSQPPPGWVIPAAPAPAASPGPVGSGAMRVGPQQNTTAQGPSTRPMPAASGAIVARVRYVLQIPGLLPGLLVVMLALSGAIVFRILSPPAGGGGKGGSGWHVVETSQEQPPPWKGPAPPAAGELAFIGQSTPVPDRKEALEQAQAAAIAGMLDQVGETLQGRVPEWKDAVLPLYAAARKQGEEARKAALSESPGSGAEGPRSAGLALREQQMRIDTALRATAPDLAGALKLQFYWEKLSRGDKAGKSEVVYKAQARLELSRAEMDQFLALYGQALTTLGIRALPYFPLLGWRYDLGAGAVVIGVEGPGPLKAAGLAPSDVVVSVSNHQVRGPEDLRRLLEQAVTEQQERVMLKVQRGDRLLDVQANLGKKGVPKKRPPLIVRKTTKGRRR